MKTLLEGKCPKCKEGKIFKKKGNIFLIKAPVMNETCPVCDKRFEKEPGYFLGAMYVSYGLAVGQALLSFVIVASITSDIFWWLLVPALAILLFSLFNYRVARIVWINLFKS
jgi:uncharacterized protein (DUF983 family)